MYATMLKARHRQISKLERLKLSKSSSSSGLGFSKAKTYVTSLSKLLKLRSKLTKTSP